MAHADSHASPQRKPNRLLSETSPYLLQHAYNPVEWYPWGPEALQRARELNRPILLSIGYSACHWCHVMERESFEDEQIAALMNERFVCVKVDREERPDLDEIYMQATLALNHGQGGWPMTVFLTPEQEPIFAGTYFPPTDRWGRPGFATVLRKISDLWRDDPQGLQHQAGQLTGQLRQSMRIAAPTAVGEEELTTAVQQFREEFDSRHGGFGGAPKFPPATALSFLLRRYHKGGQADILAMVRRTLDAMASGGLYDQIGGGFHRYATDDRWLVPHFEKMLYDNALLAKTYVEAYQVTGEALYRRIASETLDYILREMTGPEGGFYSATDADSEGVEGKFFVWTPAQVQGALRAEGSGQPEQDARAFCVYYDITAQGNWHEPAIARNSGERPGEPEVPRSIPHVPRPAAQVAADLGITEADLVRTIERLRPMLYRARQRRVPPGLDDKVLTGWNGLMISAMAEAGRVFGEALYVQAAGRAADFLLTTMQRPNGRLFRTYRGGQAHLEACLEDYACLAEGFIDLYEAGAAERCLAQAAALADRIVREFADAEHGGFFTTAADHERLILRSREGPDGATPSANAVAASVLARLSFHDAREDYRDAASRAIRVYGGQIRRYPRAFAKSLIATQLLLDGPVEVALIGTPTDPAYQVLHAAVSRQYLPDRILAHQDPSQSPSSHPLLAGKTLVTGRPAVYVCRNFACQAPIVDPAQVGPALADRDVTARPAGNTLTTKRLAGHATAGGTGRYAVRAISSPASPRTPLHGFTAFGATGLTASRLGFGGYRIVTEESEHREALSQALLEGCNVIDTSTNYTDGDSERLIGSVLMDLIGRQIVRRDEIIVISKIGYVQGHNLELAQAREKAGRPYPELVKYAEGLWHCIHPEFLADQLTASLDRLSLTALDVCLLHNPEYFLMDAKQHGGGLDAVRDEFYARLETAFEFFERQVATGSLQYYGVSSNTCIEPANAPEATSVSRMVEAAQRAARRTGSDRHHFAVLQCPMNLFESGAALQPNTGPDGRQTVLDYAGKAGIAVLVNRPLNAIPRTTHGHGAMIRLAEPPLEPEGRPYDTVQSSVAALEEEYRREIAPQIRTAPEGMPAAEYFQWAEELARVRPRIVNLEHWEQIENQMVAPHLNQVLRALGQHLSGEPGTRWERWRDRYLPELVALLRATRREATLKSREKTASVSAAIDPLLPEERRGEPLSRKALWVLVSTPGVTCVLTGMRTPSYVKDSMAVLEWTPLPDPHSVYRALTTAPL